MGAELLALAVRRILRDDAIFNVLSSDVSNGVELVLEKRRSVSRMPDVSGAAYTVAKRLLRRSSRRWSSLDC
jgi:hypothetical protein